MKIYMLSVGLEHLQSGIEFENGGNLSFTYETPTLFLVWSLQPFTSIWHLAEGPVRCQAQHSEMPNWVLRNEVCPWTNNMVREQVARNQSAADTLRCSGGR